MNNIELTEELLKLKLTQNDVTTILLVHPIMLAKTVPLGAVSNIQQMIKKLDSDHAKDALYFFAGVSKRDLLSDEAKAVVEVMERFLNVDEEEEIAKQLVPSDNDLKEIRDFADREFLLVDRRKLIEKEDVVSTVFNILVHLPLDLTLDDKLEGISENMIQVLGAGDLAEYIEKAQIVFKENQVFFENLSIS